MAYLTTRNKNIGDETINCGEVDLVLNAGIIMDYNDACWGRLAGQWTDYLPLSTVLSIVENEATHV